MIQTSYGVWERLGEPQWQSPSHQVRIEVDTRKGVRSRSVAGIRGQSIYGTSVGDLLTDRAIDAYARRGYYDGHSERHPWAP